jgi:hypothetical protein
MATRNNKSTQQPKSSPWAILAFWFLAFLPWVNGQNTIFWTDSLAGRLQRSSADGAYIQTLLVRPQLSSPGALAINPGLRLYIGDGTRIFQAELDGKNPETFISTGITAVTAIAAGPDGKIYWTDISGMVNRANADKTGVETWISKPRINAPGALVYDPNTLRWFIGDGNRILWANATGDTVEVLINTGITSVSDLAIGPDKKLYWTDRGSSRVMRANANGTGVEQLLAAPAVSSPEAIAIDQTTASTTLLVASGNKILRAELNGSNVQTLVSENLNLVSDLAIQPGPLCIPVTILRQPADTAVCEGKSVFFGVQVQGTKPYQYQWRKNGQNISGAAEDTLRLPLVQLADAGQYDCVIKNACGSITSRKAELTVYPNPKAEIRTIPQPPEICRGTKLQVEGRISGGAPAYTFRWQGDSIYLSPLSALITTFQADTFGVFHLVLEATDARGCSGADTLQITVFDNPKVQPVAAPNPVCPNDPVQLQGNPTGGSGQFVRHEWTSANGGSFNAQNIANPVFFASQAGVYTLTYKVTDSRQCEGIGQAAVTVNPRPAVTLGSNSPVCAGAGLQLTAAVSGGSGNYGYTWGFPNNASSTAQNPLIAPAGIQHTGTYRVTVTDLNTGCTATASIDAQVIKVEVQASIGRTICLGDSLLLTSQASGGTEPYTYNWFQGSISPANQVSNTAFFRLTPTATSFYIVVAEDARMCRDTDTTIVRISDPTVRITPSKTIACEGDALRLTGEATGGVSGYSFRWSHNLGILTTVEDYPKTTTTYGLTVTDFIGCIDSANVTIQVDIPQVQITANQNPVCPDQLVTFTARATAGIGPFTFTWNRGTRITDNGSQIQDRPNAETVYKVTMEDAAGCLATAEFTLLVFDPPQVSAWTDKVICPGEKALIKTSVKGGTGPFVYQWNPASNDQPNHEVGPLFTNQTFYLTVTDNNACEGYTSVLVEVYPEHKVTAGSNQPICEGEELKLTSTASGDDSGFDFEWTLPDGSKQQIQNLTISNAQANTHSGAYTIRITGKTTGCKADVKIDVKVYPAPQITINGPKEACEGADISLQANLAQGDPNDYEFTWSTPDGKSIDGQNLPLPKIQLSQAGKYTVTVTLKGSATCQASATHDLNIHPSPRVSLATDKTLPICRNTDVTVTAAFTDDKGTPLAVKDVKRYLDGQQITGLRFVDLTGVSEVFHLGGDQTEKTKAFRVVATDDIGCEGEASIQTTVIGPELKLNLDKTDVCKGATISATTTYTAGTNPKFTWNGFNLDVSPSSDGSSATLSATTGSHLGILSSVTVTLTDDSHCKAADSKEIHVWDNPDFSIIADPSQVCKDQDVKLKTSYIPHFQTTTEYKWSTGSTDPEITVNKIQATETFKVTVTLISPAGTRCEGKNSLEVPVGELKVSIAKNKDSACPGEEVILTASAEGAKNPKYKWDNEESGAQRKVTPSVTTLYRVTVTDGFCKGEELIQIERVNYEIRVKAAPTTTCPKEKVILTSQVINSRGNPVTTFNDFLYWPEIPYTGAGPVEVFPEKTTTYHVLLVFKDGCTFKGEIRVVVNESPSPLEVTAKTSSSSCSDKGGGKIELVVGGGLGSYEATWSDGGSGLTRSDLKAGTYSYTVTSGSGACKVTATGSATVDDPKPLKVTVNGSSNLSISIGQNIAQIELTASATGGTEPYTFSWEGGRKTVTGPGDYPLNVTDANGCTANATVQVRRTTIIVSRDPNDIIGPEGYGEPRWVSVNEPMPYTIRFENDPKFATAPAQKVLVEHHPDPSLNLFSMRLSDFGFANQRFHVPANSTFYSERLNLRDSLGILVDVTAGIDVTKNKIFWIFESIDPQTGLAPSNPQLGLLPVNDPKTHKGEGFASFTIAPRKTAPTGDSVLAKAAIVFDLNETIATPQIFNVIDAVAPQSRLIDTSTVALDIPVVTLSWNGSDDPGGSGIRNYSIYASDDGGPFTPYKEGIAEKQIDFAGTPGHKYDLYVLATDNTGNQEAEKVKAEKTVYLKDLPAIALYGILDHYCAGDSIHIQWASSQVSAVNVYYYPGAGQPLSLLGAAIPAANGKLGWKTQPQFSGCLDCAILIRDTATGSVLKDTVFLKIHPQPSVDAGPNHVVCSDQGITLQGSGAQTYQWTPSQGLDNSKIPNPKAVITQNIVYYLEGTDSIGCSQTDSVALIYSSPVSAFLDSLTCDTSQLGIRTRKLTAANGCDSLIFITYYPDTVAPQIMCDALPAFRLDTAGKLTLVSSMLRPYLSDNCSLGQILFSPSYFTCADTGVQTLQVLVFDGLGNSASCAFKVRILPSSICRIRVVNNEGATITAPCACRGNGWFDEEISVVSSSGELWQIDTATLLDPATNLPYPRNTILAEIPAGSGRYRLKGIHQSGIGYLIRVKSPAYPGLTIPLTNTCYYPAPEIAGLDDAYCQTQNPSLLKGSAGSAIGTGSFSINGQPATTFNPTALGKGDHTVKYRFDAGTASPGNAQDPGCVAEAVQIVSVEGTGHPVCGGQGNFFTFAYFGEDTLPVGTTCSIPLAVESFKPFIVANYLPEQKISAFQFSPALTGWNPGDPVDANTTVRMTYVAQDNFGNRDTFAFDVTYVDKTAPSMKCKQATLVLTAGGTATLDATMVNDNSFDGCGMQKLALSRTAFSCADIGLQSVRLTGTDINGNTASCETTVTIQDPIRPVARCRDTVILLDVANQAILPVDWVDAGSSDNCSLTSFTLSRNRFDSLSIGRQLVTLTVSDAQGNRDSCQATVTVMARPTAVLDLPDFAEHILIYPNPVMDLLTIEVDLFKKETLTFELSNPMGQAVYDGKADQVLKVKKDIDLTGWPSGVYLLTIRNVEGSKISLKVVRLEF